MARCLETIDVFFLSVVVTVGVCGIVCCVASVAENIVEC